MEWNPSVKTEDVPAKLLSRIYLTKPFQNFNTLNLIEYNLVEALERRTLNFITSILSPAVQRCMFSMQAPITEPLIKGKVGCLRQKQFWASLEKTMS